MAERPNERNERPPIRNETSGGRASEASEAGLRSRRKQTRQTTERASERLRGGDGRKNTGRRAGREAAGGRAHDDVRRLFLRQGTNNEPIEDERTRRGGRADEAGGLVGGRGGVRTGKAHPPRGGASRGRAANDRLSSASEKKGGSRNDVMLLQLQP